MKARQLLRGASYDPETLRVIGIAFDDAWSEIAHLFEHNELAKEAARLKLANTILCVAREGGRDAEALKRAGLRAMALGDRGRPSRMTFRGAGR